MDDNLKRQFKKDIANYQNYMATVGSWESKPTLEERIAAWKEEQKLAGLTMIAERFLPRKPLTEEQVAEYVEGASEFFGVDTSEIRKWFAGKKKI